MQLKRAISYWIIALGLLPFAAPAATTQAAFQVRISLQPAFPSGPIQPPAPSAPAVPAGPLASPSALPGATAAAPSRADAGICTTQSLGEATGAIVQVACSTGQFVSIAPAPGTPFLGVSGDAFRYLLHAGGERLQMLGVNAAPVAVGTVTAIRLFGTSEDDETVQILVSF